MIIFLHLSLFLDCESTSASTTRLASRRSPRRRKRRRSWLRRWEPLELKSLSMTDQEVSVGVKWENYLASTMNRDLVRSPELKALFRYGVPHEHRSQVWRWCVSFHVKKFRDHLAPDYYETLLNVARDKPNPASKQIELDLLRTLPSNKHYSSPSAGGIQKLRNVLMAFSWRNPDIGYCQGLNRYWRAFCFSSSSLSPLMPCNRSLLLHVFPQAGCHCLALSGPRGRLLEPHSYRGSVHAKRLLHQDSAWLTGKQAEMIYCDTGEHGTSCRFLRSVVFLSCDGDVIFMWPSLLLLTYQSRNAVHWSVFLSAGSFSEVFPPAVKIRFPVFLLVQVDQRVFKDLIFEKLPRLHAHFEQHKVDFSLITFNWFLVVFVDSVVSDILFKIWDAFLYEGPKVRGKRESKTLILRFQTLSLYFWDLSGHAVRVLELMLNSAPLIYSMLSVGV